MINNIFKDVIKQVLEKGYYYKDPNRKKQDVSRLEIPYYSLEYDMSNGYPLINVKPTSFHIVKVELLWMLKGITDVTWLQEKGVKIWNTDAERWGKDNLGKIYGHQWRRFSGAHRDTLFKTTVDQVVNVISNLLQDPYSTRHVVTAWNPAELHEMALPPCHFGWQIICYPDKNGGKPAFDLVWDQRSVDVFLGLSYNIGFYALLGLIISQLSGYKFKTLRASLRNVHLYNNAIQAATQLLNREPIKNDLKLSFTGSVEKPLVRNITKPTIEGNVLAIINALTPLDIQLKGYTSHPNIPVKMLTTD